MDSVVGLLALCRVRDVSWYFVARQAQRPGGLDELLAGRTTEKSDEARQGLAALSAAEAEIPAHREWAGELLRDMADRGIRLTTVLDDDYPANLRTIFNLPPFLFYRGHLLEGDARSVAVVGTRQASMEGIEQAQRLVRQLVEAGVTVLSGLARGIDTAAHESCLASGGRTVAVVGTGILRTYPPENAELADRIAETGAVVSQFWPDTPPTSYSFPRRNITMSGMAQGTVVIEASATSGAKLQARRALEHGRRLFLPAELVRQREWAQRYVQRPGAIEVKSVDDIVSLLQSPESIQVRSEGRRQLTLTLT
ncbi:MAG: DNA-processing protein DprA [Chloroflexota bacterium]